MMELAPSGKKGVPKTVFVKQAMKVGAEDSCIRAHTTIRYRLCVFYSLADQLSKRPGAVEVGCRSNVNLVSTHGDAPDRPAEERWSSNLSRSRDSYFRWLHGCVDR